MFYTLKKTISTNDYPKARTWMIGVINRGHVCISSLDFLEDVMAVLIKQVGRSSLPLYINVRAMRYTTKDGYQDISGEWGALLRRELVSYSISREVPSRRIL